MVLGKCELKTNTRHFDSPPKFFPSIHLSIYPRIYEHSILPAGHYSSWMKFFEFRSRIDQEIQRKDHSPESSLKWTKEGATETILLFHFVSGISALSTKEFQRWHDSRRGSSSLRTESFTNNSEIILDPNQIALLFNSFTRAMQFIEGHSRPCLSCNGSRSLQLLLW